MSASAPTETDVPARIRCAAEALTAASPTPRPAVPWLTKNFELTVADACRAIGYANTIRAQRKTSGASHG